MSELVSEAFMPKIAALCYACNTPFDDGEKALICMVTACASSFHAACAGASHLTAEEEADWACPKCRCEMARRGDYSLTPVGASNIGAANVTLRKKQEQINASILEFPGCESEILSEVKLIRREMGLMKDMMSQYDRKLEALMEQLVLMHNRSSSQQEPCVALNSEQYQVVTSGGVRTPDHPATDASVVAPPSKSGGEQVVSTDSSKLLPLPAANEKKKTTGVSVTANKVVKSATRPQRPQITERPISVRCTGSPTRVALKAVEPRKFMHLWNMVSGLDDVKDYLKELCPAANCIVEELKTRGEYKSYKIGIPDVHFDRCFTAEVWPDNAMLKVWVPFRASNYPEQQRA